MNSDNANDGIRSLPDGHTAPQRLQRVGVASVGKRSARSKSGSQPERILQADDLGGPVIPRSGWSIGTLVHKQIRDAILSVKLMPNTALSENELSQLLNVSRQPVREALQKLATEGLVTIVPQVRTLVAPMDIERIREAVFMREAVECAALRLLPKALPLSEIRRLRQIVSNHRKGANTRDQEMTLTSDDDFHRTLLEMAGMPGLWRYVLEAREIQRRVRVFAHSQFDSAQRAAEQHDRVIEELAAGRITSANEALQEHIRMNMVFANDIALQFPAYFSNS